MKGYKQWNNHKYYGINSLKVNSYCLNCRSSLGEYAEGEVLLNTLNIIITSVNVNTMRKQP